MPEQLGNKLQIVGSESESERKTRQTENIEMQFRKTSNAQKNIFYKGVKMYNALPSKIR